MKIKPWRVLAVAVAVPVLFFAVSCNDEALSEVSDIAKDSHMALNVPAHVQERLDFLIKNNPDKKYIMIEMGSTGNQTLQELQERYGLPGSVEVFKDNAQPMRAEAEAGVILKNEDSVPKAEKHGFIILEYDQNARKLSELSRDKDVFTIVDETASFPGGMTEFYKLMSKNLRYPEDAKANGIEGKVFVEFIVEKDGSVSEVAVKKGLYESIDTEAVRAMMLSPKWNPGKQNGKPVRQRLVLPLSFSTGKEALLKKATSVMDILYPIPPIRLKEDNC